jgi:tRNA threonylcarbamoyl adenosine modification protein (Sua5/YciO/YrdC/YwlC family)
MAQYFHVHPVNPQPRLVRAAVEIIKAGGVIAYPTDSCYALGCHREDHTAVERIRRIRGVGAEHHFTLVCRDLSELGKFARVDNVQYRLLKANTPGSYTFILEATKEVPRRLQHPKRSTIGLRIPDHAVVRALLGELQEPLLSSTLLLPGDNTPLTDGMEIRARLEQQIDLVLDGGNCPAEMTTVIDLSGAEPHVLRIGKGPIHPFGLS